MLAPLLGLDLSPAWRDRLQALTQRAGLATGTLKRRHRVIDIRLNTPTLGDGGAGTIELGLRQANLVLCKSDLLGEGGLFDIELGQLRIERSQALLAGLHAKGEVGLLQTHEDLSRTHTGAVFDALGAFDDAGADLSRDIRLAHRTQRAVRRPT